jgi:cytochrome c peroxidase
MHGQWTFYDPVSYSGESRIRKRQEQSRSRHIEAGCSSDVSARLACTRAAVYPVLTPPPSEEVFETKAQCAQCHVPPIYTEPGWTMHNAKEICIDDFQADCSPDRAYRTTPLGGLHTREKGGFYHDGRFKTLDEVVSHYNSCKSLNLLTARRVTLCST